MNRKFLTAVLILVLSTYANFACSQDKAQEADNTTKTPVEMDNTSVQADNDTAVNQKGDSSMVVENGKTVKVNYKLTVDGELVDSSEGKEPLTFEVGNKQMIPGFEKSILGMKQGEKKSFQVQPEDAYGQENPQAFQEVPKDKLPPDVKPEAGLVLYIKGPNGQPYPVKIKEVKETSVILNFNHPLAGKKLDFDVEVVEIK